MLHAIVFVTIRRTRCESRPGLAPIFPSGGFSEVRPKNMAQREVFSSSAPPRAPVHGKHPMPATRPFTGKQDRERSATSATTRPPALEHPPAHP